MLNKLLKELEANRNKQHAGILQRFFKTDTGQYGEGDIFLGIKVPIQRDISKKYDLSLEEVKKLLDSKIHEHRMCALFMLIYKYKKNKEMREKIFQFI